MNKITLNLIRHGQTEYNKIDKIQGSSDIELSEVGTNQAKNCCINFDINYDIAFHSSLKRSKDTLNIIWDNLKIKPTIEVNDLIIERSYGIFEGLTKEMIKRTYPDKYEEWLKNENVDGEGVESIENVIFRIIKFFNYLITKKYTNVLVVTHSGVLYALYKFITNTNLNERPDIKFKNCSSQILEIYYNDIITQLKFHIGEHTYEYCSSPTEMIISTSS